MVVRDYGMDEFVDEFCDGMKPSAAIRAYNSCKETYDWMRDGLYLSNGDIASLSEVRRNMAKTSPIVPTTSYRTTMISRGA